MLASVIPCLAKLFVFALLRVWRVICKDLSSLTFRHRARSASVPVPRRDVSRKTCLPWHLTIAMGFVSLHLHSSAVAVSATAEQITISPRRVRAFSDLQTSCQLVDPKPVRAAYPDQSNGRHRVKPARHIRLTLPIPATLACRGSPSSTRRTRRWICRPMLPCHHHRFAASSLCGVMRGKYSGRIT